MGERKYNIRPCPFCGGPVEMVNTDVAYYVECIDCFSCGPTCNTDGEALLLWEDVAGLACTVKMLEADMEAIERARHCESRARLSTRQALHDILDQIIQYRCRKCLRVTDGVNDCCEHPDLTLVRIIPEEDALAALGCFPHAKSW